MAPASDFITMEAFHSEDGMDLHFRFMGEHRGQNFIVNVQLSAEDECMARPLGPAEYEFVISRLMLFLAANVIGRTHENDAGTA
jgi:hypothetical protein